LQSKAFVVGEEGLHSELNAVGIETEGLQIGQHVRADELHNVPERPDIVAVVAGMDQHVTMLKLSLAMHYARQPGCLFVATNRDSTYPSCHGLSPGTGAIISFLECCIGRPPDVVIAKPSAWIRENILEQLKLGPAEVAMVGDRLDTDIKFGNDGGLTTILVETGINNAADCQAIQPTFG